MEEKTGGGAETRLPGVTRTLSKKKPAVELRRGCKELEEPKRRTRKTYRSASPPDVRRGSAPPVVPQLLLGCAPGSGLPVIVERVKRVLGTFVQVLWRS